VLISFNNCDKFIDSWLRSIHADVAERAFDDFLFAAYDSVRNHNGMIHFWDEGGTMVASVHTEPFYDGVLLFNLKTGPEFRRQGYATKLLKAVLTEIGTKSDRKIYVHIDKKNIVSMQLHQSMGFRVYADYGRLIDGTVSRQYFTLIYKINRSQP